MHEIGVKFLTQFILTIMIFICEEMKLIRCKKVSSFEMALAVKEDRMNYTVKNSQEPN